MAAETPERLRFGKEYRLKTGRDFRGVREKGERCVLGCLIANWRCLEPGQLGSRLGVVTSGKIGSAVVRSRARRLLREAFRLHQNELTKSVDLVLVARNSIVGKDFAGVERDFLAVLRRAGLVRQKSGV